MNYGTIELATPRSREIGAAQRWLLTVEGPTPDLHVLAHTVNAYDRMDDFEKINNWLAETVETLSTRRAASFRNQELLDFLFLMVRKDRFCAGILGAYEASLDVAVCELKKQLPLRTT